MRKAWLLLFTLSAACAARVPQGLIQDKIQIGKEIPSDDEPKGPWMEQIGTKPLVYYLHNFLTPEERAHIVRVAAPRMKRSYVVGANGENIYDDMRTSYGTFLIRQYDPVITTVEKRIALVTHTDLKHQEGMQILRYKQGQKYDAHYDSSGGENHRTATMLMYLSDVEEGGESVFPNNSEWYDPAMANRDPNPSECAKGHVHAKPKAGDAILFYSFFPNGTRDDFSRHAGCPVVKGIKWSATIWIHVDEYYAGDRQPGEEPSLEEATEPGLCEDYHDQCATWAKEGECDKHPAWMMGVGPDAPIGGCRRTCKRCSACDPQDTECIFKNRERMGLLELNREEMESLGVKWWFNAGPSPEL